MPWFTSPWLRAQVRQLALNRLALWSDEPWYARKSAPLACQFDFPGNTMATTS